MSLTSANQVVIYENLLNSKYINLNKSGSKFLVVGLSVTDFFPKIQVVGANVKITLSEEQYRQLQNHTNSLFKFFYGDGTIPQPLDLGGVTVQYDCFDGVKIIKLLKDGKYLCLGKESVYQLNELDEVIHYKIQQLRNQEFENYFMVFYNHNLQFAENFFNRVHTILDPEKNYNSDNVCTMLEMLYLYPKELEEKIKNGPRRKYYEENRIF